jgi:hypothetical protein
MLLVVVVLRLLYLITFIVNKTSLKNSFYSLTYTLPSKEVKLRITSKLHL